MGILSKLLFSGACVGLGWLLMARIEPILRYAREASSRRQKTFLRFLKAFSAFLAFVWALSLWTAAVAVWVSWPLAWLLALAFPLMIVIGLLIARALVKRRDRY